MCVRVDFIVSMIWGTVIFICSELDQSLGSVSSVVFISLRGGGTSTIVLFCCFVSCFVTMVVSIVVKWVPMSGSVMVSWFLLVFVVYL